MKKEKYIVLMHANCYLYMTSKIFSVDTQDLI